MNAIQMQKNECNTNAKKWIQSNLNAKLFMRSDTNMKTYIFDRIITQIIFIFDLIQTIFYPFKYI